MHIPEHISSTDNVSNLEGLVRLEVPSLVLIKARQIDTSWYKDIFSLFSNFLEWSLDTIKNSLENA